MSRRQDPYHKLVYVQRGLVQLLLQNGQTEEARRGKTGTVLVISAGVVHQIVDLVPSVILLVCLGVEWLQRGAKWPELWQNMEKGAGGVFELEGEMAQEWENLWRRALLEQGREKTGSGGLRDALTLQLLVMLARLPESSPDDSVEQRVRRVTRELHETFFDRWTVDKAAEMARLSRRHFTENFRVLNGLTLINYLNEKRLDHAESLILSGRHTITGAVFSSGFEDLAHFYRLFKKRHHRAPGAWLSEFRTSNENPG